MTFSKNDFQIMQSALDRYGANKQSDIAIEEMSELIKAIIKHRRYKGTETYENIIEEIADVMIMMEQLAMVTDYMKVSEVIHEKLNRLSQRMGSEANVTN